MLQIDRHFSTFLVSDMTMGNIPKGDNHPCGCLFQSQWLRRWNSPAKVKVENKFASAGPLREKALDNWLNKVSFWAQVYLQICSFSFVSFIFCHF